MPAKRTTPRKKTPKKTAKKRCVSPRNGQELTPGNPGNRGGRKGRSGRKPLAFKELCQDILEDRITQQKLREAAQNPTGAGYGALIKTLASYAAGLPAQTVQGDGDRPVQVAMEVDTSGALEHLLRKLDGIRERQDAARAQRAANQ
jgi:hypothetical protein